MNADVAGVGAEGEALEHRTAVTCVRRPHEAGRGPILVAGPDRSGTTLMYSLLASHPDVSMVRRTNMWRWFRGRYGDLGDRENLERCLHDLVRYKRMRHLQPDEDRIRREFLQGERTYGRLFALFHEHHAERAGKRRWGDKSLHTEHYADAIFVDMPDARIIHMVRDPRDRYASVRKRHGADLSRVGAATGRWIRSTRAGRRNEQRYTGRYLIVRYEDLVSRPATTMRRVCAFIGEDYVPDMLTMHGLPELRERGSKSSFGDVEPNIISTRAIGRFTQALSPEDVAFIQLFAGREMSRIGYQLARVRFRRTAMAGFIAWHVPKGLGHMLGWMLVTRLATSRVRVPAGRLLGKEDRR